jgi:hypothetical protein
LQSWRNSTGRRPIRRAKRKLISLFAVVEAEAEDGEELEEGPEDQAEVREDLVAVEAVAEENLAVS